MAYKGHGVLMGSGRNKIVTVFIGFILLVGLLFRKDTFLESERTGLLVFNILLIIVYTALILFVKNNKTEIFAIMALTCVELFINAESLYSSSSQYDSVGITEYREYINEITPIIEGVKEDDTFYRVAIDMSARRTLNDPFMFNLYSLDSYTSVEKQKVMQIAENFGYTNSICFGMHYDNGSTKAGESFLGVKYIISSIEPGKEYVMLKENGGLALYENLNVLPFAFFADKDIMKIQDGDGQSFRYMNELYHSLDDGQNADIFSELPRKLIEIRGCDEMEDGSFKSFGTMEDVYLEYEFETDTRLNGYVRYDKAGISEVEAFVGTNIIKLHEQRGEVKRLGNLEEGTKIRLRFYLSGEEIFYPDCVYVYGEHEDILETYAEHIKSKQVNVMMHTDSWIDISCINESDDIKYLLCTIPYEDGWKVKVDGSRIEIPHDAQNFIAVPIEPGAHEIELRFVPPGLYIGVGITIGAIAILVLILLLKGKFRASKYLNDC